MRPRVLVGSHSTTAQRPENPTKSVLSGQKALLINSCQCEHSEAAPEWYGFCSTWTRQCRPSHCPSPASASLTPAVGGSSRGSSNMVHSAKNTICLRYDGD